MRLIDADALIPMMKYATIDNEIGVFPIMIGFDAIQRVIDDAPTIDAVEVVRCKDCRYYWGNLCEDDTDEMYGECRWDSDEMPNADDFCSYGVAKMKGGNE